MPNPCLRERLGAIQQSLMAHYRGGVTLPAASRGSERETFLRDFLQQVFPPTFRFGTGAITDPLGNRSGQLDIVIEYPMLPSFPMPSSEERLYLAGSVAAVLSVKSNLSSQWKEVEGELEKLSHVKRNWSSTMLSRGGDLAVVGAHEYPIPFFAVGYRGFKSTNGLKRRLMGTDTHCRRLAPCAWSLAFLSAKRSFKMAHGGSSRWPHVFLPSSRRP